MTDQSVRGGSSGSSGKPDAVNVASVTPPANPSAPPANGKPAGTRLGFSNYLGLAGALLAMIVLFSLRAAYIGDGFDFLSNPIAPGISPAFLIAVAVICARGRPCADRCERADQADNDRRGDRDGGGAGYLSQPS
jgi:hypothetical protein